MVASGKGEEGEAPVAAKATQSAPEEGRGRQAVEGSRSTRPRIDACRGGGSSLVVFGGTGTGGTKTGWLVAPPVPVREPRGDPTEARGFRLS